MRGLAGWLWIVLSGLMLPALPRAQDVVPAVADDGLRVALVTAAPGALYWERFGHNAILIEDTHIGARRMYNFGWFDFDQKNFMLNFVRGRMLYQLAATDPLDDIDGYRREGRSVWLQELDLSSEQKRTLAQRLATNALPQNAEYRYDYYYDNCSTRVRDALDSVLGGALKESALGRGRGETYRSLSLAYAREIPWLALGIHLGLGPAADRRINFWEEAFLPLRLRDLVADFQVTGDDGIRHPLVISERTLYAGAFNDTLPPQPNWFWQFLLIGLLFSLAIAWALRQSRTWLRVTAAGTAAGFSLVVGLIGIGLAGLWLATDHQIAWRNANFWLFSPLCLLMVVPLWQQRRPDVQVTGLVRVLSWTVFAIALTTLLAGLLKLNTQAQSDWLALMLPWHLMVLMLLKRTPAP